VQQFGKVALFFMFNRREFIRNLALAASARFQAAALVTNSNDRVPTLYYMDGYHGGVQGHMPPGCWRDILSALREFPEWKLSLDIEASSWEVLRRSDPQAYEELGLYLKDPSPNARVEMVAATFAQPYGWAISGESNIRQLQRGLQVIHEHFSETHVVTYAVQEPCWASCLPQILRSLRFDGVSLKNASTAWCGYTAGFDAEVVRWIGPDGTEITAVPRYAVEKLEEVWETESVDATAEFSEKCVAHGIDHPAGMCFQDLGWAAKPRVQGSYIGFATWREYIHAIAGPPTKSWRFGIEDILVTLPWGDPTLRKVAQQVRSAENRLITAEKIAAIAFVKEKSVWPEQDLRDAWDGVLLSQAHDAWITATTRQGRDAWSFRVASNTFNAQQTADEIIGVAASALSAGVASKPQVPLEEQWVRVINPLGYHRDDLAQLELATDPGTTNMEITDSAGNPIASQLVITRDYLPLDSLRGLSRSRAISPEGSDAPPASAGINNAVVLFRAHAPSMGYASYRLTPSYQDKKEELPAKVSAIAEPDGTVVLQSDLYRIQLDPKKGGAITSLFARQLGKELCAANAERLFNEYRGYFIEQQAWRSSTDQPAQIRIIENGPLRATAEIEGQIGGVSFRTQISLVEGQRRIDFRVRFLFDEDTWIGDPWDIKPEDRRTEERRSQNDGRWKLQAFFPVAFEQNHLYKNAAFDVCRSKNVDTFFQRWDEIKHNIIVNWVDLVDAEESHGIALLSDHTTAYTHGPTYPLALVLGWAWQGGFWWGKRPLRGEQEMSYAIVPHQGRWDQASIAQECSRFNEPFVTQLVDGHCSEADDTFSLLTLADSGIQVSTLLIEKGHLLVRLFNAESSQAEQVVSFSDRPLRVEVVELDGGVQDILAVQSIANNNHQVKLRIPRFGLRTLRCAW
jgi:alpha-mannosidase